MQRDAAGGKAIERAMERTMGSSQRGNGRSKVVGRNLTTTTKREDL
jgi:hypothetical protein